MDSFLIGLLSALVSTNQPVAVSNLVARTTGISVTVPNPNDPVEKEYQKLLETDDAAQEAVDKWIRDETAFREQGAGLPDATLKARIEQRLKGVRDAYDGFLRNHPDHARAHLAYGSFLMETHEEEEAVNQMEKARELDPKNPAAWNNLANYYGHRSPLKIAPDDKEREGVYIHLARIKLNAERFEEVHRLLNNVTNEMYASLKSRLIRNLERQEKAATATNGPAPTEKK